VCRQAIESACDHEASPGEPVASTLHIQNCPEVVHGATCHARCRRKAKPDKPFWRRQQTFQIPGPVLPAIFDWLPLIGKIGSRSALAARGRGWERGDANAAVAIARAAAKCIDTGNLGGSHEEKAR
jgi:hypothetical protein